MPAGVAGEVATLASEVVGIGAEQEREDLFNGGEVEQPAQRLPLIDEGEDQLAQRARPHTGVPQDGEELIGDPPDLATKEPAQMEIAKCVEKRRFGCAESR